MTGAPYTFDDLAQILALAGGSLTDSAVAAAFVAAGVLPSQTAGHDWDALKAAARAIRAGEANPFNSSTEEAA